MCLWGLTEEWANGGSFGLEALDHEAKRSLFYMLSLSFMQAKVKYVGVVMLFDLLYGVTILFGLLEKVPLPSTVPVHLVFVKPRSQSTGNRCKTNPHPNAGTRQLGIVPAAAMCWWCSRRQDCSHVSAGKMTYFLIGRNPDIHGVLAHYYPLSLVFFLRTRSSSDGNHAK